MPILASAIYFLITLAVGAGLKKSSKLLPAILILAFLFVVTGIFAYYLVTVLAITSGWDALGVAIMFGAGLTLGYDHTKSA